jgi:hypothetical protein
MPILNKNIKQRVSVLVESHTKLFAEGFGGIKRLKIFIHFLLE